MKKKMNKTRELLGLGFIALLGLVTLFLITSMSQSTGSFVYAKGFVQLTPEEACNTITTCKTGPAVFVSSLGGDWNQPPGQYALCICPENVKSWNEKRPKAYKQEDLRIIPFAQLYHKDAYYGYE